MKTSRQITLATESYRIHQICIILLEFLPYIAMQVEMKQNVFQPINACVFSGGDLLSRKKTQHHMMK